MYMGYLTMLLSFLFLLVISCSNVIKEWTDDQMALLDESSGINRIYLIYADWCGACRRFKPKFTQITPKLVQLSPSPLEIVQINLDKAPLIGSRFRISHLPSLFHQMDGEFRKIDGFRENLDKYFHDKAWSGMPTMGTLSPPRDKTTAAAKGAPPKKSSSITDFIESLGVTVPTFVLLSSTSLLFIALFLIWCIWLYTDYKLNAHNFTDEAIKERIKFLKTQPEFRDQFDLSELDEKDDSGAESDTETETEPETSSDETVPVPLRGRRSSIKNRLK